jgi:hypothetical protein
MASRVQINPLRLVQAYVECVRRDVLPAFDNLETRANDVANDEYDRLLAHTARDDWDGDASYLAEAAENKGAGFYETFAAMRQSLLNLFAVGLFHLLEQQVADLCHDGAFLVSPLESTQLVGPVSTWYLQHFDLNLQGLPSWPRIDELRLVANVTKHAEGNSADQLRRRRPALFCPPCFKEKHPESVHLSANVARPLAGDDLYVTPEVLQEYGEVAMAFLSEIEHYFQEHRDEHYPRGASASSGILRST